jgi:hypothetical protein
MSFTPPRLSGCHTVNDDVIVESVGHSFNPNGGLVNLLFNPIQFDGIFGVFVGVDSTGFP